ncbi:MAG: hypothetical protein AUG51_04405 [Acidobacteria bacterium 13_1_20CM_3_53_8]|nr:MAG: hypothetical protein AUG51_04405 [Acidobacteria bacterium 13_1_20CM_3_53_8]
MLRKSLSLVTRASALMILLITCISVHAQTPTPTPNPAQQDATRPPGTQQNQPIPEQARPTTENPTAPPGTNAPAPQAPPGVSVPPSNPTTQETPVPATVQPEAPPGQMTPTTGNEVLREPLIPQTPSQPLPPMPDLSRLGVRSDNVITLSLNDAIRRALENNNDIEVARNDVRFAETQLRSLTGVYDPIFSITPQINNLVQSQQSTLGGASSSGTVATTDLSWNPSINKQFGTGGGNYQFFFNNNRRTTTSTFNQINPVYSASLGATFTQPLWRNRSIDFNRREIRIQRKRVQQSDADFRQRTINVIAQVQRAYWDLVFALRDLQNLQSNFNLTRERFRQTEARVAAGATAPLERAEVQTELANRETSLLSAVETVSAAENALKQLILRDPNAQEWTAQITPTDEPTFDATPVNLTDALDEAHKNRPEIQRLRLQHDINDIDLQYYSNQTKPRIDIQSTVATTGLAGTPVSQGGVVPLFGTDTTTSASAFLLAQINDLRTRQGLAPVTAPNITVGSSVPTDLVGGYGRMLSNLFNLNTRNVVVGVAIQIPFRNTTAEANLAGARIQRNQLDASTRQQEQTVEVEVRDAAQSVETARRRVLAARAARENAEVQLAGEQRLFQAGRSTIFLLFQRENTLANARNLELRAETDYNKALADLQRATSTTLRANNVIIETPTAP